jgi:ABC-type siderophore export system fused ATPase/permease subunit
MEEDNAEEKARRAAAVKKAEMKRASLIFMLSASLVEIVISLVIIMGLYVLIAFLVFKVCGLQPGPTPFFLVSTVVFIAGLVLGFFLYKKIMRLVIDKMKLQDKLQPDIIDHYLTNKEWKEKHQRR